MKTITNLSAIIGDYDALLLDLWGVIHDGSHLYPGVKDTLVQLRAARKKIIFISNAPRRAAKAEQVLNQLGVDPAWYDDIITSGEMGYQWLASSPSPLEGEGRGGGQSHIRSIESESAPLPNPPPQGGRGQEWGRRYYYIGPPKDRDILDGLDFIGSDDIEQSDFLLNVGFGSEEQCSENWQALFAAAHARNLPMLCLNPDLEVVKISGERYPCAGVLALDYEKLGGKVTYYGKPYPEIYDTCMQWLGMEKSRVLAVGDGIATDIAGAVRFGMDSVLVTGGILRMQSESIETICRRYNAAPDYIIPAFTY